MGVLLIIGGLGYPLDSLAKLLLPGLPLVESVFLPIFSLMTFGETVFILWPVAKGAKIPQNEPIAGLQPMAN